ncbi:MAG: hypothetical protein G01um101470_423 [Parcubacteria group bacterium Gr01-1014_70]|nr:MAG: hypothetical protein G01um101470_423 [Parcubacteria group bacterium Gr01-1014_70]
MKPEFSDHFLKKLDVFPVSIRRKFEKQLTFLLRDIRYPSLRAKKYLENENIWQARVDDTIRFYFRVHGDTYTLLDITCHPK